MAGASKRSPPPPPPPPPGSAPAPAACQVQCAGCRCVLNVPPGVIEFRCPKCKLAQMLPPQLHPQVMLPPPPPLPHLPPPPRPSSAPPRAPADSSKIQLPCANCRAVLSVPPDLSRFVCPQCRVELAVDPAKLAGYMNSLAHLSYLSAGNKDVDDPLLWNKFGDASLEEINEVALEVEKEEDENGTVGDTFMDYRPSKLSIGPPHPDPIVETSSLSSIQPPEPTYGLRISKEMEDLGALSCLQLETLVYACQRHLQHLADGTRAGFFVGDGAGVGKGRTVAGLIWENWKHDRHKALWISVGSDLKFDARRDLDDIGATSIEVHALNKLPYGKLDSKAIGVKEGVIFLTYNSLIASSEKGRSRLQQLIQWCGPDFDGLITFDECHKAKNLIPDSGTHATRTGEAVVEIQKRLPEARIVYCSATGASEPRNLGYMCRLGLWGKGTDFPHFHAFLAALEKRGVGALELVAMDMKARGMYVCRTLSFQGAEFEVVEVPLEAAMKDMYAKATRIWGDLRVEFMQASELLQDKKPLNQLWRVFWANHQRFFRHMCMSAKVPAVVRLAKQALSEGNCVVIGLQSTGEARTEEAISKYGAELDDFVSGPKELLLKLVEDYYPLPQQCKDGSDNDALDENVMEARKAKPKDGLSGDEEEEFETECETDSSGSEEDTKTCNVCAVENRTLKLVDCALCGMTVHYQCLPTSIAETAEPKWLCPPCADELREIRQARKLYFSELRRRHAEAKSRKMAALEVIRSLDFPNNPLDDIIDQLGGPDCVAEMTGRRGMLVRASNGKGVVYQARNTKDVPIEMINMHEKQQFMDGKKHIAVISEAASAGISLQADRRAINQRRRVHVTLELPWSADRAIQQFGRTHRSNQASAPQYRLLFTNLGGERRFASVVAKRLETLGALTQGDRRAGPSLSAFNYDSAYGKKALSMMYKSVMEQVDLPVLPPGCTSGNKEVVRNFLMEARAVLLAVGIIRDAFPMDSEDRRPSGRIAEGDMHDVARFLNRLLGVPPDVQNWLFEYFVTIFDELIHDARKEGQFDSGIVDIKARVIELQGLPKTVHVDRMSGAPTTHSVLLIDRGLTFEAACLELERASGKDKFADNGFYKSKREWLGRIHFLLAIERTGLLPRAFKILRPSTGEALREMPSTELFAKYEKVNLNDQVKEGWIQDYTLSAQQCTHGPQCKLGAACTVGKRVQEVHILGGLILPVWGSVENSLAKQDRAAHRRLRVARLETTSSDRTRVVGLHIPTIAINAVLEGLGWLQN
ncbi:protein FORGETTER 1 [Selaginella moellendorffii]|uniref:protein FORGETTER 1 n=1 Tax=Selaginella moellendorffii TaxID=88036 RepID=UPI000D1C4206|nr:protein FORGETTER 1 [Selaginella moellendorffii]|eukprot:XP_024532194.1 protein FORGETTER 1 [Selaginella moellendorffii]